MDDAMRFTAIGLTLCLVLWLVPAVSTAEEPIPVIFDSDIGGDIDDTWALAYLVRSPELDLRLVVTDHGDTVYQARVAARLRMSLARRPSKRSQD